MIFVSIKCYQNYNNEFSKIARTRVYLIFMMNNPVSLFQSETIIASFQHPKRLLLLLLFCKDLVFQNSRHSRLRAEKQFWMDVCWIMKIYLIKFMERIILSIPLKFLVFWQYKMPL